MTGATPRLINVTFRKWCGPHYYRYISQTKLPLKRGQKWINPSRILHKSFTSPLSSTDSLLVHYSTSLLSREVQSVYNMAYSSFLGATRGVIQRQRTHVVRVASTSISFKIAGILAAAGTTFVVATATTLQPHFSSNTATTPLASAHSSLRQDYNLSAKVWGLAR